MNTMPAVAIAASIHASSARLRLRGIRLFFPVVRCSDSQREKRRATDGWGRLCRHFTRLFTGLLLPSSSTAVIPAQAGTQVSVPRTSDGVRQRKLGSRLASGMTMQVLRDDAAGAAG